MRPWPGAFLPRVTVLRRDTVGRDQDGNRVFGWVDIAEALAVTYEDRQVVADDVRKLVVRMTLLWGDEPLVDATDLGVRMVSVAEEDRIFRVTEYEQNGFRLVLKGESHL